jgi:hypothetical protein
VGRRRSRPGRLRRRPAPDAEAAQDVASGRLQGSAEAGTRVRGSARGTFAAWEAPGRVYVLHNCSFRAGLVKIGLTTRTVDERAKEL